MTSAHYDDVESTKDGLWPCGHDANDVAHLCPALTLYNERLRHIRLERKYDETKAALAALVRDVLLAAPAYDRDDSEERIRMTDRARALLNLPQLRRSDVWTK